MKRGLTALLLTILLAFFVQRDCSGTTCRAEASEPFVIKERPVLKVVVYQKLGVYFEFYRDEVDGALKKKVPDEIYSIKVHHPGDFAFWQIDAVGGAKRVPSVKYGVVPGGFVQTVPKTGVPPALKKGVTYAVSADVDGGFAHSSFVYLGDEYDGVRDTSLFVIER